MVMLEESKEHQDRSFNIIKSESNEFCTAIMDGDVGRIRHWSKEYGSNRLIKIREGVPTGDFWKDLAILPLHLAASYGRVKSMQSLLSAGADPDMRDRLGQTTLHLVITTWPRVLTTKPESRVQTAVRRQSEACLRLLCEHGVNINAEVEGASHETALHLSVRYTALSAIHILVSCGADVNAVNSSGMTPLQMAAGILNKDIIASLIKGGAVINMGVKHSGNSPLHLAVVAAAMKNPKNLADAKDCICVLLEQGAQVNAVNNAGITPLHEACSMGNQELVDLLLRYGANLNKLSKTGENCLFLFLNCEPNLKNRSLLVKLFCLTSPLTVYNHKGHLPKTLTLPCFFKQRGHLLKLIQQPRRLQHICKAFIYLNHGQDKREELRKLLPERLYDFVLNSWENFYNPF